MPYLSAVAGTSAPYILVANAATGRLKPLPDTLPSGTSYGCAFSPDGALLAVAHAGSPYLIVYNTSDWSKVEDTRPVTGTLRAVSFVAAGH